MALLDQVIEESLGISIDGNIEVNFEGFISAFSEIGNLDIELTEAEARYLNSNPAYLRQMGISTEGWNLTAGVNSLTAEQALAYSRIRYVGNSDWERTGQTEKGADGSLFQAAEPWHGEALLNLADEIFPYLTTDMNNMQLLGYVYSVFFFRYDAGRQLSDSCGRNLYQRNAARGNGSAGSGPEREQRIHSGLYLRLRKKF